MPEELKDGREILAAWKDEVRVEYEVVSYLEPGSEHPWCSEYRAYTEAEFTHHAEITPPSL